MKWQELIRNRKQEVGCGGKNGEMFRCLGLSVQDWK